MFQTRAPLRWTSVAIALLAASAVVDAAHAKKALTAGACFRAIERDAVFKRVNARFPVGRASSAQLADKRVATEREAAGLRLRAPRVKHCRELELAAVRARDPLLEPAYAILHYQLDQVADYLQQQAITYGTANRLKAEADAYFDAREQIYGFAKAEHRGEFGQLWEEQLQRGHSNPPPEPALSCAWDDLNILCK